MEKELLETHETLLVTEISDDNTNNNNNKFAFLNVDGNHFEANYETLIKIPLFNFTFANIRNSDCNYKNNKNNPLFIDRDFQLFEQIYLMKSFPTYNSKLSARLLSELQYYGLEKLSSKGVKVPGNKSGKNNYNEIDDDTEKKEIEIDSPFEFERVPFNSNPDVLFELEFVQE